MNGFVRYNEKLFGWNDQIRLRDAAVSVADRGAFIIVTNADHPSIHGLYRGLANFRRVKRSSKISGDSRYRGQVTELVLGLPKSRLQTGARKLLEKLSQSMPGTARPRPRAFE
jgi:site-specific DNA-adenine methylase